MSSIRDRKTLYGRISVSRNGSSQTITFQYNPSNLRRELAPSIVGGGQNTNASRLYYTAPPKETIQVRLEIDAGDQDTVQWKNASSVGIRPQLAALESVLYPPVSALRRTQSKLSSGSLEVGVYELPTVTFEWGQDAKVPVFITHYAVTEDAFDGNLHPIRATVDLGLQVTSAADLMPSDPGYELYLSYQAAKEAMAAQGYSS